MRMTIAAMSLAGAIGIASCQSAGAVTVDAAAVKEAASAASTVQQARFYGHRHSPPGRQVLPRTSRRPVCLPPLLSSVTA